MKVNPNAALTRFQGMMLNAEQQVNKDLDTLTDWCRNYYEDAIMQRIEKRIHTLNLLPFRIIRFDVEKAIDADANLLFNKIWDSEERGRIAVHNMAMHEIVALLVHDGFNVLWVAPENDPQGGSDIVVELVPSNEYKADYLNVETVDTYRAGFFDAWINP